MEGDDAKMELPWRTIALWASGTAVCISVGTLGALAIVASVHDADGLSTIALAVAILAFTSQIIVFVSQVFASNRQTARQDEIYARMNGLLQGLKGTTDATQATMERHMGVLLKAAVGEAAEVVSESSDADDFVAPKFNPLQFEQRVLERARDVASESRDEIFDFQPPQAQARPGDAVRIAELESYPDDSEQAREALKTLEELSPWALRTLTDFGEDELSSLRAGIRPGIKKRRRAPITWELVSFDLVEFSGDTEEDLTPVVLTEKGRSAVRLLVPRGRPPDWIVGLLNTSRDSPGP